MRLRLPPLASLLVFATSSVGAQVADFPLFTDDFECGDPGRWRGGAGVAPFRPPAGIFRPQEVCSWTEAPAGDPFPAHANPLSTPAVADLPFGAPGSIEIVSVFYNFNDGGQATCIGNNPAYYGVLRILDGATCAQHQVLADPSNPIVAAGNPAVGDLDLDGRVEIVALRALGGLVAFRWNETTSLFEPWWATTESDLGALCRWDGPVLHDLDDDGYPEVIAATEVFDGRTGTRLDDGNVSAGNGLVFPAIADVDADGEPELVSHGVWWWNDTVGQWQTDQLASGPEGAMAIGDFGTTGTPPEPFDPTARDGIAEIVRSVASTLTVQTLGGQQVVNRSLEPLSSASGAPAVGDFDGDGEAEVAVGNGFAVHLIDLECAAAGGECVGENLRWTAPIADLSSQRPSATAFDFDRDGRDEVLIADECFARIYDGNDGAMLASIPRRSCTWAEEMPIADVDGDGSAEILLVPDANCNITCPAADPNHPGLRCAAAADCVSGVCDAGFCRCTSGAQCPGWYDCLTPLPATPGSGNTCRAVHPVSPAVGLIVVGDAFDRWGATSTIWNQHTYSVTNVGADGVVPRTSESVPNHLVPRRNDFRVADSVCAP